MTGDVREQLTQLESLSLLQLACEVARAHPVRLINDRKIPRRVPELPLKVVVARQVIHPGDQQVVFLEDVEIHTGIDHLRGEDLEGEPELEEELVLPLLDK